MSSAHFLEAGDAKFFAGSAGGGGSGYAPSWYPVPPLVPPALADFDVTGMTFYGTTVTADQYGIVASASGSGGANVRIATQAAPVAPYSVRAAFQFTAANYSPIIGFRNPGTGRMLLYIFYTTTTNSDMVWRFSTPSAAVNVFYATRSALDPCGWLRMDNTGANLEFFASPNGIDWTFLYRETLATWVVTPSQVAWGVHTTLGAGAADAMAKLVSWEVI